MFNEEDFIASLEKLDDVPCDLSFDEISALCSFAKQGEDELEYILCCAFALGSERGVGHD